MANCCRSCQRCSHCARAPDLETTGEHIIQRFGEIIVLIERVRVQKTLELSEHSWGGNENPFGVVSAREIMIVKPVAMAALPSNPGIAENSCPSSELFAVDLDEKADGSSCAKARLCRGFANIRDENAFIEAVGSCLSAE